MTLANNEQQPLRLYVLWALIGWALVGAVIYLSLTSSPIQTPEIKNGDKVGHFIAYFTLMIWFAQLYRRGLHWVFTVTFIVLGVALEIIQGQVGYRMFQYGDMLANGLGAVFAWMLAAWFGDVLLHLEQRFLNASAVCSSDADGGATAVEPPILTQQQPKDNG